MDVLLWNEREREMVTQYWSQPGRYLVEPAGEAPPLKKAHRSGRGSVRLARSEGAASSPEAEVPERVNITTAGSTWYQKYTATLSQQTPDVQKTWQDWVVKRLAAERAALEASLTGDRTAPQPIPDATPPTLVAAVGEPPAFYEKVHPLRYTVQFDTADWPTPFVYTDNIPFVDRKPYYSYYRSANGVIRPGKRLRDYAGPDKEKRDALFASVGRTPSEAKVLLAVSVLEGGFEAINTYDTGFVSIGFIQFITGREGNGSLGAVLARYKDDDFTAFRDDFHRFGVDVTPEKAVAVVDPATGVEKQHTDAVRAIIDDKRLTAVFERAGQREGFRRAQVMVARERYWPGDDPVTVTINGIEQTVKASDIVLSEAGMATLMDRKVNRGNIRLINDVAGRLAEQYHVTRLQDLSAHERELVTQMKFRTDFLSDPTLTQPPSAPPSAAPAIGTPGAAP